MKIVRNMLCLVLIVFGSSNSLLAQADGRDAIEKSIDRILEVCRIVAENHVEPPAMQQMVLDAARAVYEVGNENSPRELSGEISRLNSEESFRAFLRSAYANVGTINRVAVTESLLLKIPGTGRLVGAEEAKVQSQVTANEYVGVGIELSMKEDLPRITTAFYGGPAQSAGLKTNDTILKIDGRATEGKSLAEIVNELRGEAGSEVTLTVMHPESESREIKVTRNKTFIPTVHGASQDDDGKWNYRLVEKPEFMLLTIDAFGASTTSELGKIAEEPNDSPLKGIVLDLRGGGGSLKHVVMVANQFLDAGLVGSTTIGDREETYRSDDGTLFEDVPMVVLTSRASSASSVFLAAALQDRERAVVIGQPTNGMSYLRSQYSLSNGDRLIIPSGYVRRINGTELFVKPHPLEMFRRSDNAAPAKTTDLKSANLIVPNHIVDESDEKVIVERAIEFLQK